MLNLGFLNIHTFLPKLIVSPSFFDTKNTNKDEKGKLKENMLYLDLNLGSLRSQHAAPRPREFDIFE